MWWVALTLLISLFGIIVPSESRSASCIRLLNTQQDTGRVSEFYQAEDALLIAADNGLFRREGDNLVPIGADQNAGVRKFYQAEDALLIAADNGLFRREDDNLVPIGADQDIYYVRQFYQAKDGALLIDADNGLFRREGDNLVPIGADQDAGKIRGFYQAEDALLIAADNGLFRREGDNLVPIGADQNAGVRKFYQAEDALLIAADNGLFRREGDNLVPIGADQNAGVRKFYQAEDALLIGADNGLFRREGDNLVPIGADQDAGEIRGFYQAEDALLIGADNGLFRREGENLVRIGKDKPFGWIVRLYQAEDALLIYAANGLFRREGENLVRIGKDKHIGWIDRLYQAEDALLIYAHGALFRREGDNLVLIGGVADINGGLGFYRGTDVSFYQAEDALLIGAPNGLFRREGDNLVPIGKVQDAGKIRGFYQAEDALLIAADNGLFQMFPQRWSDSRIESVAPHDIYVDAPAAFDWMITHPCSTMLTAADILFGGISENWIKRVDLSDDEQKKVRTIHATIAFAEKKDEPYHVQLYAKEESGEKVPLGPPVVVRVGWTVRDYVNNYGPRAGRFLGIIHTTVFFLLIVGVRWSDFCWRVLTDPVWGKTGLWFYFLLRHFGPLQRWIMARWFEAVRQKTTGQPYLPMSLSANGEPVGLSTGLLDRDANWQHLWVQGNAGMGKTTLVLHLQSAYFADPRFPSLRQAFAHFHCVPIIVPLREYRHVAFNAGQPGDWVPSVARMAVSAFGMPFEDHGLFRAMIRSGSFLLVLDGANEVEHDKEIELFARAAPSVRLLVTSQLPGSTYFTNWHLPRSIDDEIEPLLCLFLGQDKGKRLFDHIKPTSLLSAIRSGYDVRLIADLVEDKGEDVALPADRLGLYELILDAIRMPDGAAFPEESLCKAAWAMWRDGERKLEAGKHLDEDLLEPLTHENQKVLRILDGQQYEFRHDQMRAYLAARWAARHEAQPIGLFESECAIWRLSRKQQEEVWDFFADMLVAERPKDAIKLWKWSTDHPDRVILQHALQRLLKQAGHDPKMA